MKSKRWLIIAVIVVALIPPTAAFARFIENEPASANFGTAQLFAPTSLTVSLGACIPKWGQFDGYREVVLAWVPSVSTITDGYEVFRSKISGGPYTLIATVPGAATSGYIDSSVPEFTTYYYVVRSTRNLWRSAYSNEVSILRQKSNCK